MSQIPDPTNLCFQSNEQLTTILADHVRRLSLGPTTAELHRSASLSTVRPPTATRCSNSQPMSQPRHTSAKIEEIDDVDADIHHPIPVPEIHYHSTRSSIHGEPGDQPKFVAGASGGGGDPNDPDGNDDRNPGDNADRPDPASPCNNLREEANPNDFLEDWQRIFYAISFLHGSALEYFQPFLEFGDEAIDEFEFFHNWGNFVQALTNAFGTIAPEDDAETALMDLTFGENGRAMSYFILFAKYAAQTTFEDRFL
ncbi:hypothetical protein Clacol_006897 [Clathrus columnatus]|uniref:Retrotransposon gag domain-containing protein n=1 Tax=Clathrus columnatus TaxID=1419009 RepID=A0AAV5AHQ0_9AGAM|nr:hypothetical protein Clacol_006897 [Clathrus columnatus]